MRLGQLFSTGLLILGSLLCTTGCVCMNAGGACGPRGCAGGHCKPDCGPCEHPCDPCGSGDFYAGSPLGRLIGWDVACDGEKSCGGCKSGCGDGCGELYVDEWINERPTVDHCGCGEQLCCGRKPVRSLLRLLWGEKYCGGCETGCDDGIDLKSPIIHDGYDPVAWSNNRGCNCGRHDSHLHQNTTGFSDSTVVEIHPETEENSTITPVPNSASSIKTPTPAPPIPKSAMRLNPASRKEMR